jgi:hypothetical protein
MKEDKRIEKLSNQPVWLVDYFPERVPADNKGQYFQIEEYLLGARGARRHTRSVMRMLLTVNAYYQMDVRAEEKWHSNPKPAKLEKWLLQMFSRARGTMTIFVPETESLIYIDGGDLYLTIHSSHEHLLKLISQIAAAEGMFFRKAEED